jgi:small-conductance mechanosensitive channel
MEVGKGNDALLQSTIPIVLFRGFGDSVLNFELWVVTKYVERGLTIKSEIYQDIHNRFEKENIKIAYPQLDVHLYNTEQENNSTLRG